MSDPGRTIAAVPTYTAAGRTITFDDATTHVMGVVNLSPESKNVDTFAGSVDEAVRMAGGYRSAGATIIDLGAQSSVRGNVELSPGEEIARMSGPLEALVGEGHLVSVDTWKPAVAAAALELGAAIVNDTGGLQDPEMVSLVAEANAIAIAMHLDGATTPLAVGELVLDENKAERMADAFEHRLAELAAAGVDQVILDPGIGITYATDYDEVTRQQLRVVTGLGAIGRLGPVLLPVPRKKEPARVAAFMTLAIEHGADVIRVHDVEAACDLVRLFGRAAA